MQYTHVFVVRLQLSLPPTEDHNDDAAVQLAAEPRVDRVRRETDKRWTKPDRGRERRGDEWDELDRGRRGGSQWPDDEDDGELYRGRERRRRFKSAREQFGEKRAGSFQFGGDDDEGHRPYEDETTDVSRNQYLQSVLSRFRG